MKWTFLWITCAFAAVISSASLASSAETQIDPVERYRKNTSFHILSCRMSFQLEQMNAQLGKATEEGDSLRNCIAAAKPNAKDNFDAALSAVADPEAKEALKSYHVAFVVALEGIEPATGERKISYEVRQSSLDSRLDEAWARFEIEQ